MNCWEFTKCGCEPGGANVEQKGVCPAATNSTFNGYNNGVNAGRACWMITQTSCHGKLQGSFVDKTASCKNCDFYKRVESEENSVFLIGKHHHAHLGDNRQLHEKKTFSPHSDDEQSILYLLEQLFSTGKNPSINLITVYKEMPISNSAEILAIRGSNIVIATNELQVAAIKACGETFISSGHFPLPIYGSLAEFDVKESTVTLKDVAFAELYSRLRSSVRVRLPKPMNIVMHAGNNVISGAILDISHGGCGMNTLTTAGLDSEHEVFLTLKLIEPGGCQVIQAEIPCSVVRIDNSRRPYKIALCFNHNAQTEEVVSKFIHQRQIEILKELRLAL
jgi:hypothetical protein